jgi:nucleotide-binding universal stress UspA family protein
MFKHILVPTDGSKLSEKAVKGALEFAKALGAKLTVLHVTPQFKMVVDEGFIVPNSANLKKRFEEESTERAGKILDAVKRQAGAAGVAADGVAAASDTPWDEIINQAKKRKCDLIMMASHGRRGITGVLLGSETAKVLTHSKVPVLVYR